MPNAHPSAEGACIDRTVERHPRPRPNAAVRIGLSAVIVASVLTAPEVTAPPPVEAACGTNHGSRTVPPRSIRVLRTRTGRVQTVEFRRYVAMVMASGEWPTWMPSAALEAGAVATKQYAWYYAMRGNHRSAYRTRSGACYDVRDDTMDQLYRPEWAKPTRKQYAAIDATWGLTLRKKGRFFLTGYRAGSTRRCAADADGWKLYARSVMNCAQGRGWSRERIQNAYYGPNVQFVWARGSRGPVVTAPVVRLTRRTALHSAFATVSWRDASRGRGSSRVTRYRLQHRVADGDPAVHGIEQPPVLERAQEHHGACYRETEPEHDPLAPRPAPESRHRRAKNGRNGDLGGRPRQGDAANGEEIARREVHPYAEHQEDHADLRELLREVGIGDEAGAVRPDGDSRDEVPDERRQAQPDREHAEEKCESQAGGDRRDERGMLRHGPKYHARSAHDHGGG